MKKWTMSIITMVVLLMLIFSFLLLTPMGIQVSAHVVKKWGPGKLTYKTISTPEAGEIRITQLYYQTKNFQLNIKTLDVKWSPWYLLSGKLKIIKLNTKNTSIQWKGSKSTTPSVLPLTIDIEQAHWEQLRLRKQGFTPIVFHSIKLQHFVINSRQFSGKVFANLQAPITSQINLTLTGTPQNYQFKLIAKHQTNKWQIKGHGSQKSMHITTHEKSLLDGNIDAVLNIHFLPRLAWNIQMKTRNLNLNKLHRSLPKRFNLTLSSKGAVQEKKTIPNFSMNASIKTPKAMINIKGAHHSDWNLNWRVSIEDLSYLFTEYHGNLQGQGKITGHNSTPIIKGTLSGTNIVINKFQINHLISRWLIDLDQKKISTLFVKAQHIKLSYTNISAIQLNASGQLKSHHISTEIKFPALNQKPISMKATLHGSVEKNIWAAKLNTVYINSDPFTPLTTSKYTMLINPTRWEVTHTCLTGSQSQRLCFQGQKNSHGWLLQLTGKKVYINPLITTFTSKLNLNSKTQFKIDLHKKYNQPLTGNISFKSHKGMFQIKRSNQITKVPFQTIALHTNLSLKSGINTHLQIQIARNDSISATLHLPTQVLSNKPNGKQNISGKLSVNTDQLSLINMLAKDNLFQVSGRLFVNITLSGTIKNPKLNGNLKLQPGNIHFFRPIEFSFNQIVGKIITTNHHLQYQLQANTNNTPIQLTGKTMLNVPHYPTTLQLTGNNALLLNTINYQIYVSPNLNMVIENNRSNVSGKIIIPKALIKLSKFDKVTMLSSDVTFTKPRKNNTQRSHTVDVNILVELGEDIKLNAMGVTGRLQGKLAIHKQSQTPFQATGQIRIIDGKYKIPNTSLNIEPASSLIYNQNSLTNPQLSIRATRNIKTIPVPTATSTLESSHSITVGAYIQGTKDNPEFSFYASNSNLTQDQILSYLVLGNATDLSSNPALLSEALNSFNLGRKNKSDGFLNQIMQAFGLTELNILTQPGKKIDRGTEEQSDNFFVIGRYISPHIYARYATPVFKTHSDSLNIFQIRYLINNHWSIQTNVSPPRNKGEETVSSVDILYTAAGDF